MLLILIWLIHTNIHLLTDKFYILRVLSPQSHFHSPWSLDEEEILSEILCFFGVSCVYHCPLFNTVAAQLNSEIQICFYGEE